MKKESMFLIGTSTITIAIILGRISPNLPVLNFFEGIFTGISLVMNISFLIRYRLEKSKFGGKS